MKYFQRGFGLTGLLIILGLLVISGGAYWYTQLKKVQPTEPSLSNATSSSLQQVATQPEPSNSQSTGFSTTPLSGAFLCSYTVKDGKEYWGVWEIPGVDVASFQNVSVYRGDNSFCLGKDNHSIYMREKAVPNSDPSQFAVLPPNGTGLCQYFIRIRGAGVFGGVWQIAGADVGTFTDITSPIDHDTHGTCYAKDATHVYIDNGVPHAITFADPATFTVFNANYTKDTHHAWYVGGIWDNGGPIVGADAGTFVALDEGYAKDASRVYYENKFLAGADSATFTVLTGGFAKDAAQVYDGLTVLAGIDPASVVILDGSYMKDKNHVYATPFLASFNYQSTMIATADPQTFAALGLGYGADANRVYWTDSYHAPQVVSGADPNTFVVVDGYAKDASHIYSMGKVLAGANVETFKRIPSGKYVAYYTDGMHVWYSGGMGTGALSVISGADPATFVVTDENGDAKDSLHTYSFDAKGRFLIKNVQ